MKGMVSPVTLSGSRNALRNESTPLGFTHGEDVQVASVEDAIQALQQASDKLDEVRSNKSHAKDEVEEVAGQVSAAGLQGAAEGLGYVVDQIDAIDPAIQALADAIDEAITAAKAAIDA